MRSSIEQFKGKTLTNSLLLLLCLSYNIRHSHSASLKLVGYSCSSEYPIQMQALSLTCEDEEECHFGDRANLKGTLYYMDFVNPNAYISVVLKGAANYQYVVDHEEVELCDDEGRVEEEAYENQRGEDRDGRGEEEHEKEQRSGYYQAAYYGDDGVYNPYDDTAMNDDNQNINNKNGANNYDDGANAGDDRYSSNIDDDGNYVDDGKYVDDDNDNDNDNGDDENFENDIVQVYDDGAIQVDDQYNGANQYQSSYDDYAQDDDGAAVNDDYGGGAANYDYYAYNDDGNNDDGGDDYVAVADDVNNDDGGNNDDGNDVVNDYYTFTDDGNGGGNNDDGNGGVVNDYYSYNDDDNGGNANDYSDDGNGAQMYDDYSNGGGDASSNDDYSNNAGGDDTDDYTDNGSGGGSGNDYYSYNDDGNGAGGGNNDDYDDYANAAASYDDNGENDDNNDGQADDDDDDDGRNKNWWNNKYNDIDLEEYGGMCYGQTGDHEVAFDFDIDSKGKSEWFYTGFQIVAHISIEDEEGGWLGHCWATVQTSTSSSASIPNSNFSVQVPTAFDVTVYGGAVVLGLAIAGILITIVKRNTEYNEKSKSLLYDFPQPDEIETGRSFFAEWRRRHDMWREGKNYSDSDGSGSQSTPISTDGSPTDEERAQYSNKNPTEQQLSQPNAADASSRIKQLKKEQLKKDVHIGRVV